MSCDKCKKTHATVHVTEVVNGIKREAHLCEGCARSAGVGIKFSFSIQDMLGSLVEPPPQKAGRGSERGQTPRCPECGMTYTEFKAKARLGCANDYEVFKVGLIPLLEKVHNGNTQHVGKVPPTADTTAKMENELVRLKRDLDAAVKSENFEKAAELRDKVRTLEQQLDKGGK